MPSAAETIKTAKANAAHHAVKAEALVAEHQSDRALPHAVLAVAYHLEQLAMIVSIKD